MMVNLMCLRKHVIPTKYFACVLRHLLAPLFVTQRICALIIIIMIFIIIFTFRKHKDKQS